MPGGQVPFRAIGWIFLTVSATAILFLFLKASAQGPGNPVQSIAATNQSGAATSVVPTMTFDVASIRQSKVDPERGFRVGGGFEPINSSHLRLENNNFFNLVLCAYSVNPHLIVGLRELPLELQSATFDVMAESDASADRQLAKLSKEEVRLEQEHMVQTLLAERFRLKMHWETRDSAIYDLVVSKRGRLSAAGNPPSGREVKMFGDRGVPPIYQRGDSRYGFEFVAHAATMSDIVNELSIQFGKPIHDLTGLTGKYDFDLKYYQIMAADRGEDETNPWLPLETAIQEQLGLKIVRSHGPVKFLIIDHAEMPSPN